MFSTLARITAGESFLEQSLFEDTEDDRSKDDESDNESKE
jgi:hypothetical protein